MNGTNDIRVTTITGSTSKTVDEFSHEIWAAEALYDSAVAGVPVGAIGVLYNGLPASGEHFARAYDAASRCTGDPAEFIVAIEEAIGLDYDESRSASNREVERLAAAATGKYFILDRGSMLIPFVTQQFVVYSALGRGLMRDFPTRMAAEAWIADDTD